MKQSLLWLLSGYKRWISPSLPSACRFVPTCSEYAMEAVERHGALRGALLAAGRLLRCHPLAKAGYDPVPAECGLTSFDCHAERSGLVLAAQPKKPHAREGSLRG